VQGWKRNGLTDEEIDDRMGIGARTLYEWINRFPQIQQNLKIGKEDADLAVENALFKSACGYDYEEVTEELKWDHKTKSFVMMVTKRQKKHMPASQTAQIFWLKNRRAENWRDKVDNSKPLNEETDALSRAFEELMGNIDEDSTVQQETTTDSGISED
jgi:hypothetical protein